MSGSALPGVERVPVEFMARLDLPDPPTSEALVATAAGEMVRALGMPTAEREAAYVLLAADAYLTWACAIVAREEEPAPAAFRAILDRFLSSVTESSP
ncbi:MAG: hypothetical protein HKN73_14140 [Gemmatimonadetes bacterium]|nr:hypothetical protein [Gemmatimonadota bacterium]